ncbi:MAG: IS30 family transposase [bacterium]
MLSLVERATGYLVLGQLAARATREVTHRAAQLIRRQPRPGCTVTADNGTEFPDYRAIEAATGVQFSFATPHHAWERGTNENTNGLLRQISPRARAWPTSPRRPASGSPTGSTPARASGSAFAPRRNAMERYRGGRPTRFRRQRCTSRLISGSAVRYIGLLRRTLALRAHSARVRFLRQHPFGEVQPLLRLAQLLPQRAHLGFERFEPSRELALAGTLPQAVRP